MKNIKERLCIFSGVVFNMTLVLLLVIFIASETRPNNTIRANLKINTVERIGLYKRVFFIPGIDLKSKFNWYTRYIYIYLTCRSGSNTEEMVWSKIIKNGDPCNLNILEKSNYVFNCDGGNPIIFELRANIFPYVGMLKDINYGEVKWEI